MSEHENDAKRKAARIKSAANKAETKGDKKKEKKSLSGTSSE